MNYGAFSLFLTEGVGFSSLFYFSKQSPLFVLLSSELNVLSQQSGTSMFHSSSTLLSKVQIE